MNTTRFASGEASRFLFGCVLVRAPSLVFCTPILLDIIKQVLLLNHNKISGLKAPFHFISSPNSMLLAYSAHSRFLAYGRRGRPLTRTWLVRYHLLSLPGANHTSGQVVLCICCVQNGRDVQSNAKTTAWKTSSRSATTGATNATGNEKGHANPGK